MNSMNNFFKFEIKRNLDITLESKWISIDTLGAEIPELSYAKNEKEALEILKNVFPDAEFRNIRKLSENEIRDILY